MGQRDTVKKSGTADGYKNDRGGATLITEPCIGIVKNNVDPSHSGKIFVYISTFGGSDPDNKDSWVPVRYMSPFVGLTSPGGDPADGPDKTGKGKFVGNPQSYGFWASSPDIGTEVVCIFINGRADQGYYIGCIPQVGMLSMTPAIAATKSVVPNDTEATTYGGADRLPTTEVNYSNPNIKNSSQIYNEAKPVHSYQAAILAQQGLIRDNIRGVISSSAQRESPSRVFGLSTPGGPIFEGGYTAQTIAAAVKKPNTDKLQIIGRTGGHSFVMDDGSLTGQDQLVRLRSSAGHQITMSDTGQTLFIIHSNGQSWIEMGKEGTIDIYSTNSFNVRTQGDLNLHADKNVNIQAGKNVNIAGQNINTEATQNYSQRVGGTFAGYCGATYTYKSAGSLTFGSDGECGIVASGAAYIVGSKINMNSGSPSLSPADVPALSKTDHVDTTYSQAKGWINPAQTPLTSITSRAPAHQPWVGSGAGINVTVDNTATPANQQTTAATDAANQASPPQPAAPTSPAEAAQAPQAPAAAGPLTAGAVTTMTAQVATNAQALTEAGKTAAGVISPASGLTVKLAETAGALAPGASSLVNTLVSQGMPMAKALTGQLTGATGSTDPQSLISSVTAQATAVQKVITASANSLVSSGVLTGKESPAQAGGPIMAAVNFGTAQVTALMKSGPAAISSAIATGTKAVAGVVGSLQDAFSSGKSSGGLSDALNSGFAGLKTSLGGLGDKLTGGVTSLAGNLKSGLQNAFSAVESSYASLKGGVENFLGGSKDSTKQPTGTALAAAELESAKTAQASAEEALLEAKKAYRLSNSPEDYDALQRAEATVAATNQKVAQTSSSFMKASAGGAQSLISGTLASLATTATSGLNALPGGKAVVAALTNASKGATGSPFTSIIDAAKTAEKTVASLGGTTTGASSATSVFADAKKMAGDLVGKTTSALQSAMNSSVGGANDLLGSVKAGASGLMGQLETAMSSMGDVGGKIKTAVLADNTFNKAAITAKTGQLLGDPKIPAPVFGEAPPTEQDPDEVAQNQADAIVAVEDAQAALEQEDAKLGELYAELEAGIEPESVVMAKIETQQKKVDDAQDALQTAQVQYEATVTA